MTLAFPLRRPAVLLALSLGSVLYAAPTLNYSEGGDATEDPAATDRVSAELRRYIDALAGDDAADGRSPAKAWRTIDKVNTSAATFAPGTYVLFQRGQTFEGDLSPDAVQGAPGKRIVFGAYGPGHADGDDNPFNNPRPVLPGRVLFVAATPAKWIMIRDLDTRKIGLSQGAPHSDVVIFNNVVHGRTEIRTANLIGIADNVTRCAIVQNLVYDTTDNDLIALHGSGGVHSVGSSHWVVDNVIIGNQTAEGAIDFALGNEDQKAPVNEDYKIIGNRIQMRAGSIPGVRQAFSGSGARGIEGGHLGRHIWIMGNMITGARNAGLFTGGLKHHAQISGNLLWRNATSGKNSADFTVDDTLFAHNTILHHANGAAVVELRRHQPQKFLFDALRWAVQRNLFVRTSEGAWFRTWSTATDALTAMDRNWFGGIANGSLNDRTLAAWQESTGHDRHSAAGATPGISLPAINAADENPLMWYSPEFLAHFTPAAGWAGNDFDGAPAGALDAKGNWFGGGPFGAGKWRPGEIRPFTTLSLNDGFGWEGPLLVQLRYPLLRK